MIYKLLQKLFDKILWVALACSLQSCGYRSTAETNALSSYQTMTVPYVEGDAEGQITQQVIATLTESGAWKYRTLEADLILKVKIIDTKIEDVGYNRYYFRSRRPERWMVPNERLYSILAEVSVIEASTSKVLLGPVKRSARVKYDFDPEFDTTDLLPFSLGQFNFVENAQNIAKKPLNEKLAQNIVDYLLNSW